MNSYGKANKVLKALSTVISLIVYVYISWVLCTPGYYILLVLFGVIALGCLWLKEKLKKLVDEKYKSYTYEELTEHKFGSTYRKRFYSIGYLIMLITFSIASAFVLICVLITQCDKELNKEYLESMNYTFGTMYQDDEFDNTIYRKLAPVIPNHSKVALIDGTYTIKLIVELAEVITEAQETGAIEEETLLYYESEVEALKNKLDNTANGLMLYIYIAGLSFILFKYSFAELKDYTHHRSIELRY